MKNKLNSALLVSTLVLGTMFLCAVTPNGAVQSWNGDAGRWVAAPPYALPATTAATLGGVKGCTGAGCSASPGSTCAVGYHANGFTASTGVMSCANFVDNAGYADNAAYSDDGYSAGFCGAFITTPSVCTNQFARGIATNGNASCAAVNLSSDTAATALPATKGGTGLTTTTSGSLLGGAATNTVGQYFGDQAQAWMGSASSSAGSFQETTLRTMLMTSWTNSTTTDSAIFTLAVGKAGYHTLRCSIALLCTATACPTINVGGGTYDSTGYYTLRSHRTGNTPNWDHMAQDGLSTECTSGCYTSVTRWSLEGSFYTSAADTVYVYGKSGTSGQTVTAYAGSNCLWN